MTDAYKCLGITVFKPRKRIRQMLNTLGVHGHIALTSTNQGEWRLVIEVPSGRVEVNLDAEGFSRLMRSQYSDCIVELRGQAKHAGLPPRGFTCDVTDLPKDVIRESAWSKTEQYGKKGLDLMKFPKLRAFVIAKTAEMKLDTSCVTSNFSQRGIMISISEIV